MHKRTAAEIRRLVSQNPESRIQNPGIPKPAHQIFEYLHLAAALGASAEPLAPQLFVMPAEVEAVKVKFGLDKITPPVFGLNPGAEYGPAKRWPAEKFISAAKEIQQRTGCAWILFGGKGDLPLATQIQAGIQNSKHEVLNLAGNTSLHELMALLKVCRVLLTNDTGPMHVAAALGTPGDARNRLIKSDAPCSPCFLRECPIDFRCLNGISVERVVAAVLETAK
jgi:heptosyltransferase-2